MTAPRVAAIRWANPAIGTIRQRRRVIFAYLDETVVEELRSEALRKSISLSEQLRLVIVGEWPAWRRSQMARNLAKAVALIACVTALSACVPQPTYLAIAPACKPGEQRCVGAYPPHEVDAEWMERVLADHELCRAVPP